MCLQTVSLDTRFPSQLGCPSIKFCNKQPGPLGQYLIREFFVLRANRRTDCFSHTTQQKEDTWTKAGVYEFRYTEPRSSCVCVCVCLKSEWPTGTCARVAIYNCKPSPPESAHYLHVRRARFTSSGESFERKGRRGVFYCNTRQKTTTTATATIPSPIHLAFFYHITDDCFAEWSSSNWGSHRKWVIKQYGCHGVGRSSRAIPLKVRLRARRMPAHPNDSLNGTYIAVMTTL